jgi:hypothetical protein
VLVDEVHYARRRNPTGGLSSPVDPRYSTATALH